MNYSLERFEKETDMGSYIDGYVNVEEFLPRCMECGSYGRVWSCPPFQFDPMELWRSYRRILIQGYRLSFGEDRTKETMTEDMIIEVDEDGNTKRGCGIPSNPWAGMWGRRSRSSVGFSSNGSAEIAFRRILSCAERS